MTLTVLPAGVKKKKAGGFIKKSLRFRGSASAYLNRTFGSGTATTFTISVWVKRGILGTGSQQILYAPNGTTRSLFCFNDDTITFYRYVNNTYPIFLGTTSLFRDPSAWYHVVAAYDTKQATASDRVKIYVNNNRLTSFNPSVFPALNGTCDFNTAIPHAIGRDTFSNASNFDGCLAEYNFIDGQALDPTSFGEIDATTGVWTEKKYAGTYGKNGFRLNFEDNTTLTALGHDSSGNNNHWTPNNISLSGVTNDSMTDVPTPVDAAVGNYAVINPLDPWFGATLTNGNLTYTTGVNRFKPASIGMTTGKFYCEYTNSDVNSLCGLVPYNKTQSSLYPGANSPGDVGGYGYFATDGGVYAAGAVIAHLATCTSGDVVGMAYDADTGKFWLSKNGLWMGSGSPNPATGVSPVFTTTNRTIPWFFSAGNSGQTTIHFNFGQQPFRYPPPSGFLELQTNNIPKGIVTASGTFTGNALADGVFVWTNGTPTALTINGNAVVWGTHADKLANGFKLRTAAATHNVAGNNTYVVTTAGNVFREQLAQTNP